MKQRFNDNVNPLTMEWLNAYTYIHKHRCKTTHARKDKLTHTHTHTRTTHLNSDRAVDSFEDLGVVYGVDLNEQGQAFGHCDEKENIEV